MPVAHLTDVVVSRLKEPGTYFDENTPAFGIRVGKNRKTWIVIRGRERSRTRIGRYPAVSLAEARKKALVLLGSPIEARPEVPKFSIALAQFYAVHLPMLNWCRKGNLKQYNGVAHDPKRPIREADIRRCRSTLRSWRQSTSFHAEMRRKPTSYRGSNVNDYRNERQGIHAQISWGELPQVLA
jgi:Arm DNA-binding domain